MTKCKECGKEISAKAEPCPSCGVKIKKTSLFSWIILIFIVMVAIDLFSDENSSGSGASKASTTPKAIAMSQVSLDFKWNKIAFDSVMKADFAIKNDSEYQIKDITIECPHYAASETKIDSNKKTIFDVVPKNSKRIFKDFTMGFIHSQIKSSGCKIVDLKIN
jgi:hypothetical protein